MKKTISILFMLGAALPALAVESVPSTPTPTTRANLRKEAEERREEVKEKREEKREEIKTVREEAKVKISAIREDLKASREKAKTELKAKMAKFKDAKKKEAVERINDNISKANDERTAHYSDVLSKLSIALDRVEERTNKHSTSTDVTAVRTAIATARQAITDANTAVKAQSDKVYTLLVTDEATLKQKVGEVRQMLKNDLSKLHNVVKLAKEAVRNSATTLAKIQKTDEKPESVAPVSTTTVNQ